MSDSDASSAWDIFESESLTVRRAMSKSSVQEALHSGELNDDDLARPSGTNIPWKRLGDITPGWNQPIPEPDQTLISDKVNITQPLESVEPDDLDLISPSAEIESDSSEEITIAAQKSVMDDTSAIIVPKIKEQAADKPKPAQEISHARPEPAPAQSPPVRMPDISAKKGQVHHGPLIEPSIELKLPVDQGNTLLTDYEEDEEDFTLSRSSVQHVEELDLAAMVDVAFQLVLFFMVTASVTMIKSMELPKPTEATKPAAAASPGAGSRSRNEVESEFIVVSIANDGSMQVDDEPTSADELVTRLRDARNATGKTGMILRADNKTKHRLAVAAYDAANTIGLRIAIERETSDQ